MCPNNSIKIFESMFTNPVLFESEYFINVFGNIYDKIKWIEQLNINIINESDNIHYKYADKIYYN